MTNEQIIADIAMTIYGEDAVMEMLENGEEIPLHTVQGWASRGPYKVKKGEHGLECRLWKKKKNKKSDEDPGDTNNEVDKDNLSNRSFCLCKSYLFRADQVEIIKKDA